jgi:hypothetical protein
MNMPGITDTDEVRATVRKLTDALYEYLCLDITAYERAAKAGKVPAYSTASQVPDMGSMLAMAVEERDRMQARLDTALVQLEEVPDLMQTPIEMAVIDPLRHQIENQERFISELQSRMEQTEAAVAQSDQKQSEQR